MSTDAHARIIITAVTAEAAAAMQSLGRSMGTVVDTAQGGGRTIGQSLASIRTNAVMAAGAITAGLYAVRQGYNATIGRAQDYAKEIRDLSLVTNQTATQTSRLAAVFDDFELTTGDLTIAARQMRDQGLSPNIETMARLSDEFRAIQDPALRAEFLMTNFGRSGARFANAMNQGGDALRQMGAEVASGLILTDQDIAATEELRLAQDALNDSVQSVALTLGMRAIPALASWTGELVRNITTTRDAIDPAEELGRRFGGVAGYAAAMEQPTLREAFAIRDLEDAINGLPASHTTTITADTTQANQVLDDFMARLSAAGMWSVSGAGGFSMGAGGRTVIGGGGGGGGGGLTASQQTTNTWRTSHGYSAWTGAQFSAAGMASGGPLGRGWSLVGEAGAELITPGREVIPHAQSMELMRRGLVPEIRAQGGDDYFLRHSGRTATGKPTLRSAMSILGWGATTRGGAKTTGGGEAATTAAATAAVVAEATAPIAEAVSALVAVMPTAEAISQASTSAARTQTAALIASNRELAAILQAILMGQGRLATDGGVGRAVRDNIQSGG